MSVACHEKTNLNVFVILIPKEALVGRAPSILYTDYKLQSVKVADYKSSDGVIPKEEMAEPHPPILLLV